MVLEYAAGLICSGLLPQQHPKSQRLAAFVGSKDWCVAVDVPSILIKTITNHPPVITMFIGGMVAIKNWVVNMALFYPRIFCFFSEDPVFKHTSGGNHVLINYSLCWKLWSHCVVRCCRPRWKSLSNAPSTCLVPKWLRRDSGASTKLYSGWAESSGAEVIQARISEASHREGTRPDQSWRLFAHCGNPRRSAFNSCCTTAQSGSNSRSFCNMVLWGSWNCDLGQSILWWRQLCSSRSAQECAGSSGHTRGICCHLSWWIRRYLGCSKPWWRQLCSSRSAQGCAESSGHERRGICHERRGICCDLSRWISRFLGRSRLWWRQLCSSRSASLFVALLQIVVLTFWQNGPSEPFDLTCWRSTDFVWLI